MHPSFLGGDPNYGLPVFIIESVKSRVNSYPTEQLHEFILWHRTIIPHRYPLFFLLLPDGIVYR